MISIKTVGIVCEYNPFHNGHKYHIEQAKKITGADAAICIMSGNFVQRGSLAVCDKFLRAKTAILGGGDLVIELPVVYALSCAEKFASGAVYILDKIGVDYICFGAECSNLNTLDKLADILLNETDEFKQKLKEFMKNGSSYQKARDKALKQVHNISAKALSLPNNALAVEYLKALKKLNSNITPVLVKRLGANYKEEKLCQNSFSSATAIRLHLASDNIKSVLENNVPSQTLPLYENEMKLGKFPVFSSAADNMILYRLRTMSADDLRQINDVTEGIENRILSCAKTASSFEELITAVSSKRYTKSRISRIILCALLNIKKNDLTAPEYIRVLALNETGAKVLKSIKKTSELPIITKLSYKKHNFPMLKFDIRATDIYSLCFNESKIASADFTTSPSIIGKSDKNFVYILRCSDGSLYTGWTNDLNKRISDHNSKRGAKYTKSRTPVILEYFEICQSKSEALSREFAIKQLTRPQKENLIKTFDKSKKLSF